MLDVDTTYRAATEDELVELGLIPATDRMDAIRRLFKAGILVPIRGGSPEGDDAGGGDDKGGDGGDDAGDKGGKDGGDKGGKDGGDDAGTELADKLAKAERAAADKDKELRDLKRANDERDREAREAEGKYEELYKSEKDRADKAEKALEDYKAEVEGERATTSARAHAIAALKAANVKNPERDVVHLDLSKIDSETSAKRAATKFADANPDLLTNAPTRQKRGGGEADENGSGGDDDGNKAIGPARLRRHFAGQGGK